MFRFIFSVLFNSPQSLIYQPADQTVSDALRSLPLPRDEAMIDLRDKDLKESDDKLKIKVDHSIAASLRLLGLQNLLFLLTALMMEEVYYIFPHQTHVISLFW